MAAAVRWPHIAARKAFKLTRRLGATVAATSGKSRYRQFYEQLRLALTDGIPPSCYYKFELWRRERFRRASEYLLRYETKAGVYRFYNQGLERGTTIGPLNNKAKFYKRCVGAGLRTAPIFFSMEQGKVTRLAATSDGLPEVDLFVKPNKGKGGRAAKRWDYIGDGRFRTVKGKILTASELHERLVGESQSEKLIIGQRLVNHPAIADLSNGALCTVRIVTCLDERGRAEVTNAAFRMSQGKNVTIDNFHAGGLAAEVDIATGRLGRASNQGLKRASTWHERHPQTGAMIVGRLLPSWPEAVELVIAAHEVFGARVIVGWDVALLAEGPCLVEGNGSPDLDIIQRTSLKPIGNDRLGALLAYHTRRTEALEARRAGIARASSDALAHSSDASARVGATGTDSRAGANPLGHP